MPVIGGMSSIIDEIIFSTNNLSKESWRLNTKTKINGKNEFVHILNATLITDRAVLAIIENFQQKDGSVKIPSVLQPLTGFDVIKAP